MKSKNVLKEKHKEKQRSISVSMRNTDERQHPHPHESLLYHTNVFSTEDLIHLYSRPSCLLIYQFLPPLLLCLESHPTTTEPEPWPWMWLSWMHWAGSHCIHILNPLQKQCYPAHYINILKICPSPCFPVLLCLSTCLSLLRSTLSGRFFSCPCLELGSCKGLPQVNKTTI